MRGGIGSFLHRLVIALITNEALALQPENGLDVSSYLSRFSRRTGNVTSLWELRRDDCLDGNFPNTGEKAYFGALVGGP